jgi:hypothetical protein
LWRSADWFGFIFRVVAIQCEKLLFQNVSVIWIGHVGGR